MKCVYALIPILFLSFTSFSQDKETDAIVADYERARTDTSYFIEHFLFLKDTAFNAVGFACGYAGAPTENIFSFTRLLSWNKTSHIKQLLYSKTPATLYLTVVSLEYMERKKKTVLSAEEKERIKELYSSNDSLTVCSGCTYYKYRTLSDLLNSDKKDRIKKSTLYWLRKEVF